MNDAEFGRTILTLSRLYSELSEREQRRLLEELRRFILAAFEGPIATGGEEENEPFFSQKVKPPCCDREITIELRC
jgi:hypothetical protein